MAGKLETLDDIPRRHARERPDEVALICRGEQQSYAEWHRRSNRVANQLSAAGVKPGARIALLSANNAEFFEIFFGALKAGVVLVPVNFRLAPPEVAYVINDAGAELVFVDPVHTEVIEKVEGDLKTVKSVLRIGGGKGGWLHYEAWRDSGADSDPAIETDLGDVAIQMYTSGTTGHPKGAQLTHRNIAFLLAEGGTPLGYSSRDVSLTAMPLFHIAGATIGLIGLYHGCRNIILPEVDPAEILRLIETERVTRTLFVPAVILFLMQHPKCAETDFSSMESISYGASPIPLDLLRTALKTIGCEFIQLYGLTETTGMITYLPGADHDPNGHPKMASCGIATPGSEVAIFDEDGNPVPPGTVGEIVIKSPQNMLGYWNLPEATANAIRGDWFHSGDAGYMDEDGYVYIYDRIKDMIISGGENVYPAEVESALFEHPAVADVAVIGVPDDKWGEVGKAVVVLANGKDVAEEELIAFARDRIAGFKVPKSVAFVDELPRNPSGKLLKRELREMFPQ